MQLPLELLDSLTDTKGFDKNAFEFIHASEEKVVSIRLNPGKTFNFQHSDFVIQENVPWSAKGYYLAKRPSFTFDPLFHAGCYYVQEASSMFLEEALKQTVDLSMPLNVLDLCAAPGGKSTHLLSLISKDSLLVSNEVIRSRANILNDNIIKWGYSNVVVTNNDPKDFRKLENYFDVIMVDAPCSGSGLFRRDPEAIDEWSPNNVALCSQRQQRILADIMPALKKGGVLIYSTCSYSNEEDEEICKWMMNELQVECVKLKVDNEWKIIESEIGYRFWPDKVKGEGFFISCFRKTDEEGSLDFKRKNSNKKLSRAEMSILNTYIENNDFSFLQMDKKIHAVLDHHFSDMNFLASKLRIINLGTAIGELIRDKLVPDHALAMSLIQSGEIQRIELDPGQAIFYLQKKEINISTNIKGWSLVTYQSHPLGWINILPNRVNNYYPKMLRILKQ